LIENYITPFKKGAANLFVVAEKATKVEKEAKREIETDRERERERERERKGAV